MEYYFMITNASAWLILGHGLQLLKTIRIAFLLCIEVSTCPNQENHPEVQPLKGQHLILNVN